MIDILHHLTFEGKGESEINLMWFLVWRINGLEKSLQKVLLINQVQILLNGILTQKKIYRPNLIFWIVMGSGKAPFSQKGKNQPKIENFGFKVCSVGPQGDPH